MRKIRKDDEVMVLRGRDKGAKGRVLEIDDETNRAIVENVNRVKRHQKQGVGDRAGGIIEKPAPLPLSALALVSKKDGKPVRVHFEIKESAGKQRKVRVASRTGEVFE